MKKLIFRRKVSQLISLFALANHLPRCNLETKVLAHKSHLAFLNELDFGIVKCFG
jgi:hypothetical protein